MLLKSALVGFFVWRAILGLMPLVGGLVPLPVAMQIAGSAATGLMRDVALAGLVAAGRGLRRAAPAHRQAGPDDQEGGQATSTSRARVTR